MTKALPQRPASIGHTLKYIMDKHSKILSSLPKFPTSNRAHGHRVAKGNGDVHRSTVQICKHVYTSVLL
jgi:hypothetical protein